VVAVLCVDDALTVAMLSGGCFCVCVLCYACVRAWMCVRTCTRAYVRA
jgi:hypothetical protein